jgi:hypothetical protein
MEKEEEGGGRMAAAVSQWCLSVCSFGGGRPFHPFVIRLIIHPFKFLILEEDDGRGGGRRRTNGSSSIRVTEGRRYPLVIIIIITSCLQMRGQNHFVEPN